MLFGQCQFEIQLICITKTGIMKLIVYVLATCVASVSVHGFGIREHVKVGNAKALEKMHFVKPADSVLHQNIKVISIDEDDSGSVSFNSWQPSIEELRAAEDVLIDPEHLAVVRQKEENGIKSLVGVVNGQKIEHDGTFQTISHQSLHSHPDFIDIPMNLTYSNKPNNQAAPQIIVETLIVCDKEFGDIFQHDRVKILDYLTVYFWDMNMRYKTLPSVDISFRVTGVVVISTTSGQPFIEEARAEDGRAEFGRILPRFADWVNQNSASFPKFDLAVTITNTQLEWGGGLAYLRFTCNNKGATVFNDGGDWNAVTIGTHEIAHTLGAPHDESIEGCTASGYIMSGGNDELKWFFSDCSDRTITEYVTSDQAACLRRIDEPGVNPISPDFSFVKTPTMDEQCKRRLGPTAFIEEGDTANCKRMRCLTPRAEGGWWVYSLQTADNSPCLGGGRCFRGICRNPDFRVQNVGSGQCLKAPNQFAFTVAIEIADCPQPGTPLDRFAVSDSSNGKLLGTPWQSLDAMEHGDRCIYTGNAEGGGLWTDKCNADNPWHGWDFADLGNNEFLLQHRVTQRCAKQVGTGIQTFENCDGNDRYMRWKLN